MLFTAFLESLACCRWGYLSPGIAGAGDHIGGETITCTRKLSFPSGRLSVTRKAKPDDLPAFIMASSVAAPSISNALGITQLTQDVTQSTSNTQTMKARRS